jgi:YtfJ family uncharacterized protein
MLSIKQLLLGISLIGTASLAYSLELGGSLDKLSVPSKGELIIDGKRISYKPWSTDSIKTGSPALIFHMAARMSSEQIIDPLRKKLDEQNYTPGSFQPITVVNLDDAMWGTAGIIGGELEKNKRAHPSAILVADESGRGLKAWQLKGNGVTVALLDSSGKIVYLKEGKLSDGDVNTIITKLNKEIARVASN